MRRFWVFLALATAALAAGMLLTLRTDVGATPAHYDAAFALLLGGAAASWPWFARRRLTTLLLAYSGAVATATGFAMLYTRDFPYKDWVTWWHSVTSFAFLLAFLAHWALNSARLVRFLRHLAARPTGALLGATWAALLGGLAWAWSPAGRGRFVRDDYLYVSTWAVFLGVALAYLPWLLTRLPSWRRRAARARETLRGTVDASLFLACWGSLVTGFALLYFAPALAAAGLKYASKWSHTATSVALLALVAFHAGYNARALRGHAKRFDQDLGGPSAPREP